MKKTTRLSFLFAFLLAEFAKLPIVRAHALQVAQKKALALRVAQHTHTMEYPATHPMSGVRVEVFKYDGSPASAELLDAWLSAREQERYRPVFPVCIRGHRDTYGNYRAKWSTGNIFRPGMHPAQLMVRPGSGIIRASLRVVVPASMGFFVPVPRAN